MARQINIDDTISKNITFFDSDNSTYDRISDYYPISGGLGGADDGNYAYFYLNTGSGAQTWVYYGFDFSDIPAGATITSVSCRAKGYINTTSTNRVTTRTIAAYTGTTQKGNTATISNSTNVITLSVGSWTRAELQNAKIGIHAVRGNSNTTSDYHVRFYGATMTVNYSVSGTAYTITASSSVASTTVTPDSQELINGQEAIVRIDTPNVDDIVVTDNGIEVNDLLEQHQVPTGGTISAVPVSYTTSGSISGTRYRDTVGCGVNNPSSQTGNDYAGSSGSTATIYYHFNFDDIPDEATITSMTVRAYGHLESTSNSSEVARLNTYYGTTAKGTVTEYTSTSNQTKTIPAGNWTVAQLKDDARVGFTIGYYGGLTTGITWEVTYTVPSTGNDYYYTYSMPNLSADHVILIEEAGVYIPPEEDPEETYWPITISSINASTNPANGTTRVVEGTNHTITITPSDPQLTLALDNGVDITSQLQGGVPNNTYTVDTQVSGASYGFTLNSSTGYYKSTNDGVGSSASVARVTFDLESDVLVTIQYINQGESQADYGMFGKIDTTVSTTGNTYENSSASPDDPQNYYYMCAASSDSSTSTKTLTYEIPMGQHYIDIKYAKDQASDSGLDSLQWKILSIEATSAGGDYTYTLTNVTQKHSLIFVFGDVTFWYVTSTGTSGMRLFPDGQQVKLDGDSYLLNIVPDNVSSAITITDNGNNVTSQLERETGVDKNNNPVVSYKYRLNNISANHTLNITAGDATIQLYIKENDTWRMYSKVYKKINGSWVEQSDLSSVFSTTANYVKQS